MPQGVASGVPRVHTQLKILHLCFLDMMVSFISMEFSCQCCQYLLFDIACHIDRPLPSDALCARLLKNCDVVLKTLHMCEDQTEKTVFYAQMSFS